MIGISSTCVKPMLRARSRRAAARARGSSAAAPDRRGDRAATSPGAPRRPTTARRARCATCGRAIHVGVAPFVVEVPDHRAGARRLLGAKRVRVGLVYPVAGIAGNDMKFVHAARLRLGHAALPRCRRRRSRASDARADPSRSSRRPPRPTARWAPRRRSASPCRSPRKWAPSFSYSAAVRAFAEQVLVVSGQGGGLLGQRPVHDRGIGIDLAMEALGIYLGP